MRHDELIAHVRGIAAKMATHKHDDGDLFCLSRAAWIGERSYRIIEHVDALEAEIADLRTKLASAEADAAEVARVAGVESPAHVDDVTAAIAEMLDKEARAEAAEVALERVAFERDRVVRERDEARAKLASAEADYAEVVHVVGIEHAADGCMPEPGPLDVVLRTIRETRATADRVIEAEVARDDALAAKASADADAAAMREIAHRGWLLAKSLAMGFSESSERAAARALAKIDSATAGAALLREVEQLRDIAGASGVEVDDVGCIVVVAGVAPNERRHTVGRECSDGIAEAVLTRRHLAGGDGA